MHRATTDNEALQVIHSPKHFNLAGLTYCTACCHGCAQSWVILQFGTLFRAPTETARSLQEEQREVAAHRYSPAGEMNAGMWPDTGQEPHEDDAARSFRPDQEVEPDVDMSADDTAHSQHKVNKSLSFRCLRRFVLQFSRNVEAPFCNRPCT